MSKESNDESRHKGNSMSQHRVEGGMPQGMPSGGGLRSEDEAQQPAQGGPEELAMPKIKKDTYSRARGSRSKILDIVCTSCESEVAIYQKDGKGGLRRLYFDRTYLPDDVKDSLDKRPEKTATDTLACPHCKTVIGNKTLYKPEKRDAYRLVPGAYRQEKRRLKTKGEQESRAKDGDNSPQTNSPDKP